MLSKFTGAKYAVAVSNGTVGLRLALYISGVKQSDEVLLPPLTFIATANAISHLGAIPHFVDIENENLGICPIKLSNYLDDICIKKNQETFNKNTKRRIKAIVPVHVFGNPAKLREIEKIAKKWGLKIIEDAAEALGSGYIVNKKFIHCGLIGEFGIISFNGNKIITTGGGGALITNNKELAIKAKHLSTTAKIKHKWEFNHDEMGWNDRMPNLNAALGVAQLENLAERLKNKEILFQKYINEFEEKNDLEIINPYKNTKKNNWLVTLRINNCDSAEAALRQNQILKIAHENKMYLRPAWKPLNLISFLKECPSDNLDNALNQSRRLINLPSSPQIIN